MPGDIEIFNPNREWTRIDMNENLNRGWTQIDADEDIKQPRMDANRGHYRARQAFGDSTLETW